MSNSKSKTKTLSDRLAELANPTPQFVDPEDEYNEETKAQLDRYDDDYEAIDNFKPKKILKNKSNLRHSNTELLAASDKKYAGKTVSRKDLEDSNEEEYVSEEFDSEDADDNIQEFKSKMMKGKEKIKTNFDESDESHGDSEMESDIEDDDNDEEDDRGEEEESEEASDEEDLDDEEDGENVRSLDEDDEQEDGVQKMPKDSNDTDINKGKSIQNQISLWDLLLECRIKMHKGINLCNQLPQGPSNFKIFTRTVGENHFTAAAQGAQQAVKTMLDSCLELQEILLKSNPQTKALLKKKSNGATKEESDEEIPSDTEEEIESEDEETDEEGPQRKKMKVTEYETEIAERHQRFRDFSNRTLNLWNEKTRLASGRAGAKSSGFGAFDQSILKQIEGILADKQRLINRTRIKRSAYRILGNIPKPKLVEAPKSNESSNEDAVPKETKLTEEEEFDFEIYDDDDFYHQLLRELIEKRTGEGGSNQIALGRQWLEIQKLRSKAKRKVDSKASKGRRLRYQIHPKLVSFMAPYPENSWNDTAKNELFASLFGSDNSRVK